MERVVMPCYYPLSGWMSKERNEKTGKRSIVFSVDDGLIDKPTEVPCGQCIGCREERVRMWAVRCMHEASLYDDNCFITLTYNEKFCPNDGSLDKSHFQKFMKRLRFRYGGNIRYFMCGEYGSNFARPHFHACLFNFSFPDKAVWTVRNGVTLYRSPSLEELWSCPDTSLSYGYSSIGDVTYDSCAYVAGYVLKKITGDKASEHYQGREPEYVCMSRRPGIGKDWLKKFSSDVYGFDGVRLANGVRIKTPKYYDRIFDVDNQDEMCNIKFRRKIEGNYFRSKNDPDRLAVKEKCREAKRKRKERSYETNGICCA